MAVARLRVYPENWVTDPACVEIGINGSTHKGWYLRAEPTSGGVEHIWHTKNDGSSASVATGDDPANYVAELSGSTGTVAPLGAGFITAATRAAAIATALLTRPWVSSATLDASDAPGQSRWMTIVGDFDSLAVGETDWDGSGDAGPLGSHQFRRGLGAAGTADTAITRNLAQAIATPGAGVRIDAVSIVLGAVVSTTAANIPRLYLRVGGTATDPAGSTVLFDFGQLPVSEVVAGRRAFIRLTPAQVVSLRAALDTVGSAQLWLCVKAAATTQNTTLPVGAGWNGELADASLRVDVVTAAAGNTVPPASWNSAGMASPGAILAVALHSYQSPPSNGESYPVIGTLRDLAEARVSGDEVPLPNTVTRQTIAAPGGHRGAQLHTVEAELTDTGVRYGVKTGGDITTDRDDPDLTGAATIHDFGLTSTTGTVVMTAPTGDSSIVIDDEAITIEFKANGLRGWGWTTLPGDNSPIQPNSYILAIGTVNDGTNQHETDFAGENGDPSTPFATPVSGVYTQPNNLPALRVTLRRPADVVQMVSVGTLAAVLLLPSVSMVGARVEVGTLSATIPMLLAAALGSSTPPVAGTIAAALPLPAVAIAGNRRAVGIATCVLPLPTASVSGTSSAPTMTSGLALVTAETGFQFYTTRRPS